MAKNLQLVFSFIGFVLYTIGLWKIFIKCGIRPIWAIVPFSKEYRLAECADMKDEGAVYCIVNTLATVMAYIQNVMQNFEKTDTMAYLLVLVLEVTFAVVNLVYSIRILSELCHVFGRSRKWMFGWIFLEGVTAFIWGVSKDYQPRDARTLNLEEAIKPTDAAQESGYLAKPLESGLTININERTAKNGLKEKTLLKDIHLSVEPGNMVLLLGGSGAGKTTFVNAVTGYEQADASILLNGTNVYNRFEKMKYEIGFVPQQDLIRYEYPVFRTLLDAATLRLPSDLTYSQRVERVREVMDIFGLTSVQNNLVRKQSGGQKKRISIASEFVSDPSVFFLDEPDSGLDGIMARDLMQRLHDISRRGKIIFVITHTPDRVIDLFDKVIVLGKDATRVGRLVFYGSIDEAKAFFERDTMEDIIRMINREDEGGEGKADELIMKYAEVCHARA